MSKHIYPRWAKPLSILLIAGLVPACNHGSGGSAGGGPGSGGGLTLSNLTLDVGPNFALVEWDSDLEAGGRVDFGTTAQYSHAVTGQDAVLHHSVLLTGLDPTTTYHFNASSSTPGGLFGEFGDDVFQTLDAGSLLSDDFNSFNLNRGLWSYEDPHQRGQLRMAGAGTDSATVALEVPDNHVYDTSSGQLRLNQPVRFAAQSEWEAKFQNRFDVIDGQGGIFALSQVDSFINFGFRFDGADLMLQADRVQNGVLNLTNSTWVQAGPWSSNDGLWLRVTRQNATFTASYSTDGQVWHAGPQLEFILDVFHAGLYAGNGASSDGPFILETDYIFDNAFPLPGEDVGVPADNAAPYVYRWDVGLISDSAARLRWWSDEPSVGAVQWGLTTDYKAGVDFIEDLDYAQEGFMPGLDPASTYHAQATVSDNLGQVEVLPDTTFDTNGFGSVHPAIRVWNGWQHEDLHYNYQVFGEHGNAQDRVNIVGRIYDEDEDRIALTNTLQWSLNGGSYVTTLLGDDRAIDTAPWRLSDEGDFNIVIPVEDLDSGPLVDGYHRNELLLRASDDDGHETFRLVLVQFKPHTSWPRDYTTDFEASALYTKHGWQFLVLVVDGDWQINQDPDQGFVLRTNRKRLGYDRLFALGEALGPEAWDDYEATIPFTVMGFDQAGFTPGTSSYAIGVINRWNGHQPGGAFEDPLHGLYPMESLFTYRWYDLVGGETWELWVNENNQEILGFHGPVIVPGTAYTMKVRVQTQPDESVKHEIKVWALTDPEPNDWTHSHTSPDGGPDTGSLAIFAHHVDLVIGDITVTGL
ncbi:MAG: hypothetical protein P1V35_10910 [Planctomycetota bacterium]|nr:hypothetical protein [Planctomycetota bacterium]